MQLQQLFGALDLLAGLDLAHQKLHFGEVLNADLSDALDRLCGNRLLRGLSRLVFGGDFLEFFGFVDACEQHLRRACLCAQYGPAELCKRGPVRLLRADLA